MSGAYRAIYRANGSVGRQNALGSIIANTGEKLVTTDSNRDKSVFRMSFCLAVVFVWLTIFWGYPSRVGYAADVEGAPVPLLEKGQPVD